MSKVLAMMVDHGTALRNERLGQYQQAAAQIQDKNADAVVRIVAGHAQHGAHDFHAKPRNRIRQDRAWRELKKATRPTGKQNT